MTALNKSERVIANAESVKKDLLKLLCDTDCKDTVRVATAAIPKLNAIIKIMEK